MTSYIPPLRDIRFVVEDLLELPAAWAVAEQYDGLDADTAAQILEEAGRFAAEVLAPINSPADLQGCTFEDGKVQVPDGFKEAYRSFVEGGWPALACAPEYGGQGLPNALNCAVIEMFSAANHAWMMYPGLLHGAYACLLNHASDDLKNRYLPKLVSGEWLGTMCLTEPQAGSDVGLLRTRAEPNDDGTYAISGNKIFISGGEHDLTPNIVHLVLARLPDAPAGTRGISLFLVPKFLPEEEGGQLNTVFCDGIEKKMGIKGSATCAMRFERARSWLVGEPNRGLAAMFVMMNSARLHVALQGLAHADAAHARALRYATERVQSRAPVRPEGTTAPADPIVLHPAMRRKLLTQRCLVEGGRALAYWAGHLLDVAENGQSAEEQAQAEKRVSILTPILKSFLTEMGWEVASDALQVFGGYGYIHEYGAEQTVRDSRIAMIYEGTNEIQAIDLMQRKVLADNGAAFGQLLNDILLHAEQIEARAPAMAGRVGYLKQLVEHTRAQVDLLCRVAPVDREFPFRIADDFLRAASLLLLGYMWLRMESVARKQLEMRENDRFLTAKCDNAAYFFRFILPEVPFLLERVERGQEPLPPVELLA